MFLRLTLVCALMVAVPTFAATFTVTKTADTSDGMCDADCSLREAVIAANDLAGPDRINLGAAQTYTLTLAPADPHGSRVPESGDLDITDALTIAGAASTIDAAGLDRVLDIEGLFDVNLVNVKIRGGMAAGLLSLGGGIRIRGATVTMNLCTVSENSAALEGGRRDDGGGIAIIGSWEAATMTASLARLTVTNSTVSGNTAGSGGGIACVLCALTISRSEVSGNIGEGGDGGGILVVGDSSTLSINRSNLTGNVISGGLVRGGALSIPFGTSSATVTRNRIAGNTATTGSAIFNSVATVNANNNWWGCNYGPGATGAGCTIPPNGLSGPFTMTQYLVLSASAVPTIIPLGGTSTMTADLTINSSGVNTSAGGAIPDGIAVTFAGTRGTFATATASTAGGKANDVYTATGPKGIATLSATLDGQTVSTPINIGYEAFTDEPLVARSTVIKAVHITELRSRVNALRSGRGLPPFVYANATLVPTTSTARAQHITDLRNALAEVYVAAGITAPAYSDPAISVGMVIEAEHITQLRSAIVALE